MRTFWLTICARGYGSEDNHFVVELTYNYNIKAYDVGTDFNRIIIHSPSAFAAAKAQSTFAVTDKTDDSLLVRVAGEYTFELVNKEASGHDPVQALVLNVQDLNKSKGSCSFALLTLGRSFPSLSRYGLCLSIFALF